jgi:hypothetical protein
VTEDINQHIEKDKKILEDPTVSPQMRRHIEEELTDLVSYKDRHPDDVHDPTALELYCDSNPDALECRVYED